jgi:hypothetical protein
LDELDRCPEANSGERPRHVCRGRLDRPGDGGVGEVGSETKGGSATAGVPIGLRSFL